MIRIARRLRVDQTDAETVLWNRIRNRQIDGISSFGSNQSAATSVILFVAKGFSLSKWMADSTVNPLQTLYATVT